MHSNTYKSTCYVNKKHKMCLLTFVCWVTTGYYCAVLSLPGATVAIIGYQQYIRVRLSHQQYITQGLITAC